MVFAELMQLSAILGAKYCRSDLDVFARAFLGDTNPEAVADNLKRVTERMFDNGKSEYTIFHAYVAAEESKRMKVDGQAALLAKWGMHKVPLPTLHQWGIAYTIEGAALGVIHPEKARQMFAATRELKMRQAARAAGGKIPPGHEIVNCEEEEAVLVQAFTHFCFQYLPNLHVKLLAA